MSSVNDLGLRDDVIEETPADLPEQMGGQGLPPLMPGISLFRIPANLVQCWESYDEALKDDQGNVLAHPPGTNKMVGGQLIDVSGQPKVIQRLRVKFDKDTPLIVVGGENNDRPVATTISNQPRNRARKGEPKLLVADMAYLLRESLVFKGPLTKNSEWYAAMNQYAGKVFRSEHGLIAFCNPEKVRYINDANDPSGLGSVIDPSGQHGCGKRHYTSSFKLPAAQGGKFSDIVYCTQCQAKLRGFFQIERFLKPTPGQG